MTEFSSALAAPGANTVFGMVMRGAANRVRLPVTTGGGGNWAGACNPIMRVQYPFRYIQIMVPWYRMVSSDAADTAFPADAVVQAAIEHPAIDGMTGLAPRRPFVVEPFALGAGTENFQFSASAPTFGTRSIVLDMGYVVPAGSPFRLFCSFEFASGSSPGSNTLPRSVFVGSSAFANVQERAFSQSSSLAATSWAKTAENIGSPTTTPIQAFVPLVRVGLTPGLLSPLLLGSSTPYGTGEGFAGSGAYGDARGDVNGNAGFPERWMANKLKIGWSNISVGSDQIGYRITAANTAFRREMAAFLNPTHLVACNFANDVSAGVSAATIIANIKTSMGLYREAIGRNLPYLCLTVTPTSTSTDSYATVANQTASANRGPSSIAATLADALRLRSSQIGHVGVIDVGDLWMTGRNTGLWKTIEGTANGWAGDGSHGNSFAQYQAAELLGDYNPFAEAA